MSEAPDVAGALTFIKDHLSEPLLQGDGRKAFAQHLAYQTGLLAPLLPPQEGPTCTVAQLIEAAAHDALAYDALQYLAARLLKNGRPLPESLTAWLASSLEREIQRPKAQARSAADNVLRDAMIVIAIAHSVRRYGLTATRNPASTQSVPTACELVSQVMIELHQPLSPAAVAKIWSKAPANAKEMAKSPLPTRKKI